MQTFLTVVFFTAVIFVLYVSATRNPIRKCPRCKGAGTLPSLIPGRYRVCPRCGRRGEVKAWGGKD
jgi:hypothetical protein